MPEQKVSILVALQDKLTGPLSNIRAAIGRFTSDLQGVTAKLRPLTSGFASVAASLGAVIGANQAIAAAAEAVQAEQRLATALRGRKELLAEIVATTDELQAKTTFEGDALKDVAGKMVALGVAGRDVSRGLRVSVDLAAALGKNVEDVATDLAIVAAGGEARGIGRLVPELRKLKDEGADFGRVLDVVGAKFEGFAEDVAKTDFGRATQASNLFGDALEELGKVLAPLKTELIKGLTDLVHKLTEALKSPAARVFADGLRQLVPTLVKVAGAFAGFLILGKVFSIVGPITGAVFSLGKALVSLVAAIGPVGLAIGGILFAVAKLTGAADAIGGAFGSIGRAIGDVFSGITDTIAKVAEGKLTVEDLFDVIATKIQNVGKLLKAYIFDPVAGFFEALSITTGSIFDVATNAVKSFFFRMKFLAAEVAEASGIAEDVGLSTDKVGEQIKASDKALKDSTLSVGDRLKSALDVFRKIGDGFGTVQKEVEDANAQLKTRLETSERKNLEAIADRTIQDIREASALRDRLLEAAEAIRAGRSSTAVISPQELLGLTPAAMRDFIDTVEENLRDPLRQLFQAALEEQFVRGKLAAADLQRELQRLSEQNLQQQLAVQDRLRATEQERIRDTQRQLIKLAADRAALESVALPDDLRARQEAAQKIKDLADKQTEAAANLREQEEQLAKIEERRRTLIVQLAQAFVTSLQSRREATKAIIAEAEAERGKIEATASESLQRVQLGQATLAQAFAEVEAAAGRFAAKVATAREQVARLVTVGTKEVLPEDLAKRTEELNRLEQQALQTRLQFVRGVQEIVSTAGQSAKSKRDELKSLLEEGRISGADATRREAEALAAFNLKADDSIAVLTALRHDAPEAAAAIDQAVASIQRLRDELGKPPSGTFFTGLEAGFRGVVTRLDEMRELGLEVGRTLGEGIGGFIDILVKGGQSFRAFTRELLLNLASLIAKFAVFRALSTVFGFAGCGSVPEGGVALSRAGGGPIPGVDTGQDTVAAMLRPGEWVLRPEAVRYYGSSFMAALNDLLLPREIFSGLRRGAVPFPSVVPRFADGGEVGFSGARGGPMPALVADDQTFDRLLAGGESAQRRWLKRNASWLRSILSLGGGR